MTVKLEVKSLYKIFGDQPDKAFKLLAKGHDRASILKKTGQTLGVQDVNLAINEGEIFVVMGLSGSGKSTLVRLFNRLIEPTRGQVLIDGEDIAAISERELRRVRRRAGAMSWAVYEDIERPGLFIETFLMGSWIEHLRQQERHTMNDLLLQSRVLAFHQGTTSPAIRYLVAPV